MQISASSALLQTISSLPAQAAAANTVKAPTAATQPPALAAASKALANRQSIAQAVPQAPNGNATPTRDTPRGSLVNIVV